MSARKAVVDVVCEGPPRQFGEQLGRGLRDRIRSAAASLADFEAFRMQRPWWLPFRWYQQCSAWWASACLKQPMRKAFPQYYQRLKGMAAGASVDEDTLYLFHALEALAISPDNAIAAPSMAACSAIGVPPASSSDRQAFLAHNLDGIEILGECLVVRENRGVGTFRSLGLTCAPLGGMIDGVNEHGLAITYNWVFASDSTDGAPPISVLVDDALSNCRDVSEALSCIATRPRCGGASLMLADAAGDVAALEISSCRVAVRSPRRGRPLFHSNQYRSPQMNEVQVPRDAVYTKSAPPALHGRRALESAELRDHRLRELLSQRRELSASTIASVLADHGADNRPCHDTICMHGEPWSTLAHVQVFPAARCMRLNYGLACEAEPTELSL